MTIELLTPTDIASLQAQLADLQTRVGDLESGFVSGTAADFTDLSNATDAAKGDALIGVKRHAGTLPMTVHSWIGAQQAHSVHEFGATGNGTTDDLPALQTAIDYLYANHGGGILHFPPGSYHISDTLHVKGSTVLAGTNHQLCSITVAGDNIAIAFDTTAAWAGMHDLWVVGYMNAAATTCAVTVADNIPIVMRDSRVFGGLFALATSGVDGRYIGLDLNGWGTNGGGVYSTGANWYIRNRINNNNSGHQTKYGFCQAYSVIAGTLTENHLTQCDFSGNYEYSVYLDDGNATDAVTTISDSVFARSVAMKRTFLTMMTGCEFGGGLSIVHDSGELVMSACGVAGSGTVPFTGSAPSSARFISACPRIG